jgi:hypothetical protein
MRCRITWALPALLATSAIEIPGSLGIIYLLLVRTCLQHVWRACRRSHSIVLTLARYGLIAIALILPAAGCSAVSGPAPTATVSPAPTPTRAATTTVIALPTLTATRTPPTPTTAPTEEPASPQTTALRPDAQAKLAELASLSHYAIAVNVDFSSLQFSGRETVDFTNTETVALDRLVFRLFPNAADAYGNGSLQVSDVTIDGQPAATELTLDDTALYLRLAAPLQPGASVMVAMDFEGVVPRDFGGNGRSGYGIYNFTDGVMSLAGWYPILAVYDDEGWNVDPASPVGDSVYSDAAFYTVDLTIPDRVVVAATGVPVTQERGASTTRYVSGPARDFYIAASPDFQVVSDTVNGTDVNSYYLAGHASGGEAALRIAADALAVFNARFGPYPYAELDVIDAPLQGAGGVEYPGAILVGDFLYENPSEFFFKIATSHEVAHQWWYNTVGNDVIDEPWLDEALATYASIVYLQDSNQSRMAEQVVRSWERAYANAVEQGEDAPITAPLSFWEQPGNQGRYGAIVYQKGALFFDAVRQEIGDEAFFQALRDYYGAQQFAIGTPEELLSAFEAAAGRELDALYEKWLSLPEA